MAGYTLGLDLGANSIGWALVDEDQQLIIASGVRVFPEGVDNFDTKKEKSKSEGRRVARGMRRQIARRARRKRRLREGLVQAGLLPASPFEQLQLSKLDPYELRCRALDEAITPHQLGRVFLHLNQRRGFLSNRKVDRAQKSDDTKGMLAEINELAKQMQVAGHRTLGEHFATSLATDALSPVRGKHTRRDMLVSEFEQIWSSQQRFHPELLTDKLRNGDCGTLPAVRSPLAAKQSQTLLQQFGVFGLLFFQRPMYWPKSVVGQCELEPKRKRCPRADRLAQRFRLLQEVNNLRYIDPDTKRETQLSTEQRTLLLNKLSKVEKLDFDKIRKLLGFVDSIVFNLERGKRTNLQGMVTDARLAHKDLFGPAWHKRDENDKTRIARTLIDGDEAQILRLGTEMWGLDTEVAERLLSVDLPQGYLHLSIEALEKLVPPMERGLLYMTADGTPSALSEAGYLRPDQQRRVALDQLPEPPEVTNPVVRQALYELRKVVNSILRKYGKPARIHLELARNASVSAEERQKMSQRMREREAERDQAATAIRQYGIKVSREAIDRYLLWEEQKGECIYTGEAIGVAKLFSGEVDVDHILPYSRCLDDSFANKALCLTRANREKRNQTPYEWLAERSPEQYETVLQRARKLDYRKYRRFMQRELELDQFIERQLNDTRYISRCALEYLRTLFVEPHHVHCPKGSHTETFRWLWHLNPLLHEEKHDRKNRADHRHHAIDAVVIALTDQRRLHALAQARQNTLTEKHEHKLAEPWPGFRTMVDETLRQMCVSHRVRRKVAGALHEDTLYGPTSTPGVFVVRKPLTALTPSMVEEIRDPAIRRLVISRLTKFGVNVGRGSKDRIPAEAWKEPLRMPSGIEIKKVRLLKRDQTIQPIRNGEACVKPGALHHLCLFEWSENGKATRDAVFVSMLEAINRVKRKQQIIQRAHPTRPEAKFLLSLSGGESVMLEHAGQTLLCTFETAASTTQQMHFRLHNAGGKSSDKAGMVSKKPSTFVGRKVTVTPLGEIRWAND